MPITIDGTNGISGLDGSAATPSIQGSDTNTGVFYPAADTVAISTGGTERLRVDSTGNLRFNSGYGSVATAYGCRAWVNFNGTGTVAIRASANVSSITDRNTGKYTVNFATAMPDANYGISTCIGPNNDTELAALTLILSDSPSASSVQVNNTFGINGSGSSFQDRAFCYVAIFR